MQIRTLQVGSIGTNCYILSDEDAKVCAVIDPGDDAPRIKSTVDEAGLRVAYILLTHGHYDHTTGVRALLALCPDAKVYIHEADLCTEGKSKRYFFPPVDGQCTYRDGDELALGALTLHVLETPGHSPGSVSLLVDDALFCGDTLFAGSCGRSDLPGGDTKTLMASLRRLGALAGNLRVLPGHMGASELDREREYNPYLRRACTD